MSTATPAPKSHATRYLFLFLLGLVIGATLGKIGEDCKACHQDFRG